MRGILTLVLWAVVLTVAMNYISAYSGNTANKTSSHEIKYSEMVDMVEKDQVKEILFRDSTIYITPVDGYTYTEEVEEGSTAQPKSYTQSKETQLTLFTKQLSDSQLLPLLEEHNVAYTGYYKAQLSPVLTFMASYVLPIIIMVSLFMLVLRILSKSGGGFGGIGSVGKSNAKVYMENPPASPSRTWPVRTRPRNPWRRSSTSCITPADTPPSAPSSPRARCWWALPVPVRLCWPRR